MTNLQDVMSTVNHSANATCSGFNQWYQGRKEFPRREDNRLAPLTGLSGDLFKADNRLWGYTWNKTTTYCNDIFFFFLKYRVSNYRFPVRKHSPQTKLMIYYLQTKFPICMIQISFNAQFSQSERFVFYVTRVLSHVRMTWFHARRVRLGIKIAKKNKKKGD